MTAFGIILILFFVLFVVLVLVLTGISSPSQNVEFTPGEITELHERFRLAKETENQIKTLEAKIKELEKRKEIPQYKGK